VDSLPWRKLLPHRQTWAFALVLIHLIVPTLEPAAV
jgi:hypothetical protein